MSWLYASFGCEWSFSLSNMLLWLHDPARQIVLSIALHSVPLQPQAYEEQLGQARAIQAQLQLCEEELEARTQDLTRYAAENRNLQVRLSSHHHHHISQVMSLYKHDSSQW